MKILNLRALAKFIKKHQTAKSDIENWKAFLEAAKWKNPEEVRNDFPRASSLGHNEIVFRLGGNKWRILVKIDYIRQVVLVKKIDTHAGYNDWEKMIRRNRI